MGRCPSACLIDLEEFLLGQAISGKIDHESLLRSISSSYLGKGGRIGERQVKRRVWVKETPSSSKKGKNYLEMVVAGGRIHGKFRFR